MLRITITTWRLAILESVDLNTGKYIHDYYCQNLHNEDTDAVPEWSSTFEEDTGALECSCEFTAPLHNDDCEHSTCKIIRLIPN